MTRKIGMNDLGESTPRALFAGDFPRTTIEVTLKAGVKYPEGAVLGKNSTTGVCELVDSAQSDGIGEIFGILAEEMDATDVGQTSVAFLTGEFAEQNLTFGGSDTADTHRDKARDKSIFFKSVIAQPLAD